MGDFVYHRLDENSYETPDTVNNSWWADETRPVHPLTHRMNKYRPTNDDWCPPFDGGYVRISMWYTTYMREPGDPCIWQVTVAGADDMAMYMYDRSFEDALRVYNLLDGTVNMDWLLGLGFIFD